MERKVDQHRSGLERLNLAGPRTVRVVVADELIAETENAADGRREFEIFKIQVDPEAEFVIIRPGLHAEPALEVVVFRLGIAREVERGRQAAFKVRPYVADALGHELEQDREMQIRGFHLAQTVVLGSEVRVFQVALGVKQTGFKTKFRVFVQTQYAHQTHVETCGILDGDVNGLRGFVVNLEIVEVEAQKITPIYALLVEILEIDEWIFSELGVAVQRNKGKYDDQELFHAVFEAE